jgi:hypothetical protein
MGNDAACSYWLMLPASFILVHEDQIHVYLLTYDEETAAEKLKLQNEHVQKKCNSCTQMGLLSLVCHTEDKMQLNSVF